MSTETMTTITYHAEVRERVDLVRMLDAVHGLGRDGDGADRLLVALVAHVDNLKAHEYWSEVTALGDAVAQELQSRHPASYDAHDELIAAVDGHEWSFLAEPFLADVTESYWNRFDESGERLADCGTRYAADITTEEVPS